MGKRSDIGESYGQDVGGASANTGANWARMPRVLLLRWRIKVDFAGTKTAKCQANPTVEAEYKHPPC